MSGCKQKSMKCKEIENNGENDSVSFIKTEIILLPPNMFVHRANRFNSSALAAMCDNMDRDDSLQTKTGANGKHFLCVTQENYKIIKRNKKQQSEKKLSE